MEDITCDAGSVDIEDVLDNPTLFDHRCLPYSRFEAFLRRATARRFLEAMVMWLQCVGGLGRISVGCGDHGHKSEVMKKKKETLKSKICDV
ncbi:hypothetical protein JHK85_039137 [Glycine max]|nr:hypothetical protein JHK85_039137 [Glycine max]